MIDFITALFAGAMLAVIPMLLLRSLELEDLEKDRFRAGALIALAALAWPVSAYLFFGAPIGGLIGIAIGGIIVWRLGRKPRILFQEVSEEPVASPEEIEEAALAEEAREDLVRDGTLSEDSVALDVVLEGSEEARQEAEEDLEEDLEKK